jgi:hypothetical protein
MARRRFFLPLLALVLVFVAAAFPPPAFAQGSSTVIDVLKAAPDCAPYVEALQSDAPGAYAMVSRADFAGGVLCPNSAAIARASLPEDPERRGAYLAYHIIPAEPIPTSPQNGQAFKTLLPSAFVYASRRSGGPLVHVVGGEAPSPLAPLPLDNTATVLATEGARASKGNVAVIDVVLTPPESALPPPGGAGAPQKVTDALERAKLSPSRVLTAPALAVDNNTATTNDTMTEPRVGAASNSIIPRKLKKKIVKVVRRVLP